MFISIKKEFTQTGFLEKCYTNVLRNPEISGDILHNFGQDCFKIVLNQRIFKICRCTVMYTVGNYDPVLEDLVIFMNVIYYLFTVLRVFGRLCSKNVDITLMLESLTMFFWNFSAKPCFSLIRSLSLRKVLAVIFHVKRYL